jgi:hypothetical protein
MNLERLSRITVEEGKCGGRPCIRGLRIRVKDVLELLSAGLPSRKSSRIILFWSEKTSSRQLTTLLIKRTTSFCGREIPHRQSKYRDRSL